MRYLFCCLSLIGGLAFQAVPQALAADCESGKVEKCFVDGPNTNCVCLDQPSDLEPNPAPEPDGQINEDGGGQEEE